MRSNQAARRRVRGRLRERSQNWTPATATIRTAITPVLRASSGNPRANEAGRPPPPPGGRPIGAAGAVADAGSPVVVRTFVDVADVLARSAPPLPAGGPP